MKAMEMLTRADPARTMAIDSAGLRAQVDERIRGGVAPAPSNRRQGRPWLRAVVAFALVVAIFIPVGMWNRAEEPSSLLLSGVPDDLYGMGETIRLDGGGVKTIAVDGSSIWVMNALQRTLVRIDTPSREVRDRYPIDDHVEGVTVGGGYVWLASYDDGGGLLRFDPSVGEVDLRVPTGGALAIEWFGDSLWMSTEGGSLFKVTSGGEVSPAGPGHLKGTGLGMLWIYDPETRSIVALTDDGSRADVGIQPGGPVLGDHLGDITGVMEAAGDMWLVVGGGGELAPAVVRFDSASGELQPLDLVSGLRAGVVFDGALWLPSYTEHLLVRVDSMTGETQNYALPGRPGAVFLADGALWVVLYQPGALALVDVERLVPAGERIVDQTVDGGRMVCTAGSTVTGSTSLPTAVLDPSGWIGYSSWSMVQAELSALGVRSCAFGFLGDPGTPAERADGMGVALAAAGVEGPFVVVAAMDGVHSTRLFAQGRDDIAAAVLVDPMPLGFQTAYDRIVPGWGHPPWADIDLDVSDGLEDFGETPLVVIGQDPDRTFLSRDFMWGAGNDAARQLHRAWQDGMDFYRGLSSDARTVIVAGSGLDMIVWDHPDLVARQILEVLGRNPDE